MKHINLSNYKGSITDWTELNYINGGLADNLSDIVNIKVNDSCYNYLTKSVNLINKDYIIQDQGTWIVTRIYVKPNTTYTFNRLVNNSGDIKECNANGGIIRNIAFGNATLNTYVSSANASYIDISLHTSYFATGMFVEGNTLPTAYEPYGALVIHQNAARVLGSTYADNIVVATTRGGLRCAVIQTDKDLVNVNETAIVAKNNLGLTTTSATNQWATTRTNVIACNNQGRILINFDQSLTDEQMIEKAKTLILDYKLLTPTVYPVLNYTITGSEQFGLSSRAIITDGTNSYIRVYMPNSLPIDRSKLNLGMAELPTRPHSYWNKGIATEYIGIDTTNGNILFCVNTKKAGTTLESATQWLTGKVLQYASTE